MSYNNGKQNGVGALDIFASNLQPMEYWHTQAKAKLELWKAGIAEGYSTGFRDLDKLVRLVDGEVMILAARPSMGKSAIGMQMVESLAMDLVKTGERGCIAVFSAEMSGWSLFVRMASALSGVNSYKLSVNQGTKADFAKLEDAMGRIRSLPIWIDDGSAPTTETMLQRLAELNATIPVRAMLFDYMELGGDKGFNEVTRVGNIAKALKGIAKTLQIPVIALSQLNRECESRANKMPILSDLRSSGDIEQVADQVVFVMRPQYYVDRGQSIDVPPEDWQGIAYIQVAKHRNGPVGLVKLAFLDESAKFADLVKINLNP